VTVGRGEADPLGVTETDGVTETPGVAEGVTEGVAEGVADCGSVGATDGGSETIGVADGTLATPPVNDGPDALGVAAGRLGVGGLGIVTGRLGTGTGALGVAVGKPGTGLGAPGSVTGALGVSDVRGGTGMKGIGAGDVVVGENGAAGTPGKAGNGPAALATPAVPSRRAAARLAVPPKVLNVRPSKFRVYNVAPSDRGQAIAGGRDATEVQLAEPDVPERRIRVPERPVTFGTSVPCAQTSR
jgi:hypothetical protein